jgi:hypothetical protein
MTPRRSFAPVLIYKDDSNPLNLLPSSPDPKTLLQRSGSYFQKTPADYKTRLIGETQYT